MYEDCKVVVTRRPRKSETVISTEAQRKEKSHPRAMAGISAFSARVRFLASLEMTS